MVKFNEGDEYFDISEKILKLSDELSEKIVLSNIEEQLSAKMNLFSDKVNYLSLFKEKYSSVSPESSFYNENYIRNALLRVTDLVKSLLEKRYGVKLGTDIDFYFPDDYLSDMETLYEFFYIRHFENLINYFSTELEKNRQIYVDKYKGLFQEDIHSKDVFVIQAKKKFKNEDDVIVIHFINDIINDIRDSLESGYLLFERLIAMDRFEDYHQRMDKLLLSYGEGIVFEDDKKVYKLYMSPLKDSEIKNELRNTILMKYLQSVELL
jgi:hypothetical protein